jgi:F0F1-type ATP synthase assembly protein I
MLAGKFASRSFLSYDTCMNWQPVIVFYVKTTAWVVLPLIVGIVVAKFTESQVLFFVSLMVGFGVTCFGIYREIKEYKNKLEKDGNK